MKKLFLTAIAVFAFGFTNAQESKAYLGVSVGIAMPGGIVADDLGLKTGLNLGFINFIRFRLLLKMMPERHWLEK